MKFRNLRLLLFVIVGFFVAGKVYAEYTVTITPVNVTDSCDVSTDIGQENCYFDFLDGKLDDYIISNGVVEAGEKIMNITTVNPGNNSELVGIKLTLDHDTSAVSALGVYGIAGPDGASYGFFPKKGRNTTWSTSVSAPTATSYILIADKGDNYDYPLVEEAPMWATFYEIKEGVISGQDINFTFKTNLSATNATNNDPKYLPLDLNDLSLSVLSSVSTDGTLKTLTATGSNSLDYTFGFVPSSKNDLTYSFIVPNAVTSVTYTGQSTDSNIKNVTGLNTPHNLNVGDNTTQISVTAESGAVTVYSISVYRLSNDTSLKTFTATNSVDYGTVASINSNSGSSTTVPYKTTSTTTSATATHTNARVDGDGLWNFNTDNNTDVTTTKTVLVEAEDCIYTSSDVPGNICTSKTYTFNTERTAPSKNVKLTTIKIDGTTIPGFSQTKYEYTLEDAIATKSSMTIGVSLADTLNTLTSISGPNTSGTATNYTISGSNNNYSATANINVGDNVYHITVTSEDGTTNQTYTINLHRKSNETLLSSLSITSNPNGTLRPVFSPGFDSSSGEYTYTYDPSVTKVTFNATAKDTGKAYVSIIDMSTSEAVDNSTKTINTMSKEFNISTTKVGVIVTAEDGSTRVYKVALDRQKSTNNYLKSLSIDPGTINETFSSTKGSYTATVDPDVTSTTVTAVKADSNAKDPVVTGDSGFNFGSGNIITIAVESEAGAINNYTINVTRKMYAIADLSDLRVGIGSATPTTVTGFNKDTLTYTISDSTNPVPYDQNQITIEYDKANEYSTVSGDVGTKTLKTGNNTFEITVVSQDTKVTKTYKINVYRQKNTDNETKGVVVAGVTATPTAEPKVYEVTLPNSKATLNPEDVVITISDDATLTKPTETINLDTQNVNVYNYSVTNENGDTENYTINITRTKSSNANITRVNLFVGDETTSTRYCVMSASDNGCRIEVPAGTSSYRLEAIIEGTASVTPGSTEVYTMTNSASDSSQNRVLTVTAEDESQKEYTITVERAKSANADLKSITVTDITDPSNPKEIDLPFSCSSLDGTLNQVCNMSVSADVKVVSIDAEAVDATATITSGLKTSLSLGFGQTRNEIKVQAENPTVNKTYTLTITRALGTDATLSDLQVEGTTVTGFNKDTLSYNYDTQDYEKTSISVQGTTTDPNAKVTKIVNVAEDGTEKEVTITPSHTVLANVPLTTGVNVIKMTVTAHDTTLNDEDSPKVYTITLTRTKNNSTEINGITVAGVSATVDPDDSTKYTVTVPNNVTEANSSNITVDVASGQVATDPKATYTVPTVTLDTLDNTGNPVENVVTIPVVAEDGTSQDYTVIITRTPSNIATMNRVNLYVGDETTTTRYCVLESSDIACSIPVDVTTNSFRLEGILDDEKSSVAFTSGLENNPFTLAANESTKVVTGIVTAENKTDSTTYTITIERAKSSNNYLSDLKSNANSETMNTVTNFNSTKTAYTLNVPGTQNSITISAQAEDVKTKLTSAYTETDGNTIEITKNLEAPGQNTTIEFEAEAENGNKITYTITVVRAMNIEPRLSSIKIGGVEIAGFDPDVTEYTVSPNYPYLNNTITITATSVDTVYGTQSGTGLKDIHTIYYDNHTSSNEYVNDFVIRGIAQNTSVYQDYTIHVKRNANNSTAITKVEMLWDGVRHEATYNNNTYNITVPNSETVANDSNVFVTVADPQVPATDKYADVTMGVTNLVTSGPNTHKFTVIAEDGTEKEYSLVITRTKSNLSTLNRIYVKDSEGNDIGSWTPSFTPSGLTYTITVPEGTDEVYISYDKGEENQIIAGLPANGKIDLDASSKLVSITSTSEDTTDSTTYNLTIKRAANNNNNMASLTVADIEGNLYPVTESDTNPGHYSVTIPGRYDKVIITATAESNLSRVEYVGPDEGTTNQYTIPVGTVTKEIKITSESSASQSYYVEITREKKTDATLSSLAYTTKPDSSTSVLDLTTGSTTFGTFNVPYSTSQVDFIAVTNDSAATVVGDGFEIGQTISIAPGTNNFRFIVTAEDGTTTKEYVVTFERAKNTDATLSMLMVRGESLKETFEPENTTYTMDVAATKKVLKAEEVEATPTDPAATVVLTSGDLDLSNDPNIENDYTITVTAADGVTTNRYHIIITRPKSNDATLKTVNLTGATISPTVAGNVKSYTITVPYGATGFDIEGIPNNEDARVYGNGHIEKNSGEIQLTVRAEDGTNNVYKFTIVEAKSNDASLTGLEVAGYPFINPSSFTSTNLNYEIGDVESTTEALVVRATPSNANSIIKYYDEGGDRVTCPESTGENATNYECTITLKTGVGNDKTLTVEVTAPDGTTKRNYTIKFNKVTSADAYLANIVPSVGTLDTTFTKTKYTYTLKVPYEETSVDLELIAEHASATIKVNNDTAQFTPRTYTVTDIPETGTKSVQIQVIAEDGKSSQSYAITVSRAAYTGSSDSTLASLEVNYKQADSTLKNYPLIPIFSAGQGNYSIGEIPYNLAELQITAIPNVAASKVEYYVKGEKQANNNVVIPKESGTITVKVTAENGTDVTSYNITYTKHANNDATLKKLVTTPSGLDHEFEANLQNYNLTLDYDTRSLDVVLETNDPNATVKVNGNNYINDSVFTMNNLPVGASTVTVVVTAEDGTTQKTYKININREGIGEVITSVEFGHDISDGYIKTVSNRTETDDATTVLDIKNQLDNDNEKLEVWNATDDTKLEDTDTVGTGMIVKLIIDDNVADSQIIVIKGDTNGDGEINVIDASSIVNHFLDRIPLLGAYLVAADVNLDTDANVIDASQVVNHFLDRQRIVFKP